MTRLVATALCGLAALTLAGADAGRAAAQKGKDPDKAAVDRARKTVQTLDTVYKLAVVAITDKYVKDEKDYPAGRLVINLFKSISETGSHEVRLIDVSGKPYEKKNVAKDQFEKNGVKELKAGKKYYEQVEEKDGKHVLRAMTFVPVVMEKCTMCHPNYKDFKKDAAIGAISYKVAIE